MNNKQVIRWDTKTMATILKARESLVSEGWSKPTIRETLYRLSAQPIWSKKHYDTLCRKLGEWRDAGLIPFGLWNEDTGGNDFTPLTAQGISIRKQQLEKIKPLQLNGDGYLYFLFIEHEGLTYDLAKMLNHTVPVVSSQGQLRREHLYKTISKYLNIVKELNGNGVIGYALVDYDKGGINIFNSHKKWLNKVFNIPFMLYGVTSEQVKSAGLPATEKHQFDGWASVYGYKNLKRDLENLLLK